MDRIQVWRERKNLIRCTIKQKKKKKKQEYERVHFRSLLSNEQVVQLCATAKLLLLRSQVRF